MISKILMRRDTKDNWETNNPVLGEGEIGLVTDTGHMKIGDGTRVWNNLDYAIVPGVSRRYYYVDGVNGDDTNGGAHGDYPLKTLYEAFRRVPHNSYARILLRGDVNLSNEPDRPEIKYGCFIEIITLKHTITKPANCDKYIWMGNKSSLRIRGTSPTYDKIIVESDGSQTITSDGFIYTGTGYFDVDFVNVSIEHASPFIVCSDSTLWGSVSGIYVSAQSNPHNLDPLTFCKKYGTTTKLRMRVLSWSANIDSSIHYSFNINEDGA